MRRRTVLQTAAAVCLNVCAGCQLIPHRASRERRSRIGLADSMLLKLKASNKQLRLTRSDDILQFCQMYASLTWKPYRHTVPAGLDARTLDLMSDDTRLAHFSFNDELWEIESYTAMRTAELSPDLHQWITGLFRRVEQTAS